MRFGVRPRTLDYPTIYLNPR